MQKFGERIRELRRAKSLTLDAVARIARIRKGYLSGIENGRVNPPSPRVVRGLAKALETSPRDLLLMAVIQKAPAEIRDDLERAASQV